MKLIHVVVILNLLKPHISCLNRETRTEAHWLIAQEHRVL